MSAYDVIILIVSDEIEKIDKAQSTFWREWKQKLEEQKRVADHSRELEKIIPGVETERFLSGDVKYIEGVVVCLTESLKSEKKSILSDILKIANAYGLKRTEVCSCARVYLFFFLIGQSISIKSRNLEEKC